MIPRTTIVIPTHNRIDDLRRALKSLFRQHPRLPDEIIVVDDGSDPAVDERILEGCPDGIQLTILRNPIPAGANHARNRGLNAASGDLVLFLDDDDEFMPGKVAKVVEAFTRTNADLVYHPAINRYDNENVEYVNTVRAEVTFDEMLIGNWIGGTSMVAVRKRFFAGIGGFDEALPALQDYEAWMRAMKNGARLCFISEPLTLYHYRTGASSISKSHDRFDTALALIESRYATDYQSLTPGQFDARREWILGRKAHKNLMTRRNGRAALEYLKSFSVSKKPRFLVMAGLSLLGIRAMAWLRSKR